MRARSARRAATITLGLTAIVLMTAPSAAADDGTVTCNSSGCQIVVVKSGTPGVSKPRTPHGHPGVKVKTSTRPHLTHIQPAGYNAPVPAGPCDPGQIHHPGSGPLMMGACANPTTTPAAAAAKRNKAGPAAPAAPTVTPAQLAQMAVAQLGTTPPQIGIVPEPRPGYQGAVGLPVWMWTKNAWAPQTSTAAVGGLAVTANARIVRVVWDMGDGHQVTCTKPGTPFAERWGVRDSPDCGYRYDHVSYNKSGGKYRVTATATWQVGWGGATNGDTTLTSTSGVDIAIGEIQVVIN